VIIAGFILLEPCSFDALHKSMSCSFLVSAAL
jgi:hypothetical protein